MQLLFTSLGIFGLLHAHGKQTRLVIQGPNILGGNIGWQQTDIQIDLRSSLGDLLVVLILLWRTNWDVDSRAWVIRPVLGISAGNLNN